MPSEDSEGDEDADNEENESISLTTFKGAKADLSADDEEPNDEDSEE
jgi:hypothetical protein